MEASGAAAGQPMFVRSLVRDAVLIKPQFLGANYRDVILGQLRAKHEGVCSRHGYILAGSIAMHRISLGHVQAATLNGDVRFDVQYFASVCNPAIGSRLGARVINMNKFGVLTHSGVQAPDGAFVPVVESIVTRHVTSVPSEVDIETLQVGDTVQVEILGKKFELRDQKISVIGRVVLPRAAGADAAPAAAAALLLPAAMDALGLDAGRRRDARHQRHKQQQPQGADSGSEGGGGDDDDGEGEGEDSLEGDGGPSDEEQGDGSSSGSSEGGTDESDGEASDDEEGSLEDEGSGDGSDGSDAGGVGGARTRRPAGVEGGIGDDADADSLAGSAGSAGSASAGDASGSDGGGDDVASGGGGGADDYDFF